MAGIYRLTFNKPAVQQLLHTEDGEAADGIKVRITDGKAQFLPVRGSDDDDVLRLESRSRGGVEAPIEGSMADDLYHAMEHDEGPFLTIDRIAGGWLQPIPHGSREAPSKFIPHVRIWNNEAKPVKAKPVARKVPIRAPKKPAVPAAPDLMEMFAALRRAHTTVEEFSQRKPRRGQIPKVVREAKEAVSEFERMVGDYIPEIARAHELLGSVVSRSN